MNRASKRTRFTSPFAPLALSETDSKTLEQLSRMIVSNYVAQYEQYVLDGGCSAIDERVWKRIKQRESVRVFAQRKHQSNSGGGIDDIRQSIDSFSGSGAVQPSDLPVVLTVGSIAGTLDDLMYGLVSPTVKTMRVKTAYIDDQFADAAVLHTIAVPSQDDPFQSLVVKWAHNRYNLLRRSILSYRDFVTMERTGFAHTSTGERLGFHLMHSVHFPQTQKLPLVERGNVSVCGIYRGIPGRSQVEVYVRGVVDPSGRGSALRSLVIRTTADALIAVAKYIECSHRKKLMWRLRMKWSAEVTPSGDLKRRPSSVDQLGPCAMCAKVPSKASSVLGDSSKRRCALCARYVCPPCRIKKTLSYVPSATGKLWQREFRFCGACYTEVCRSDAFTVALHEFVRKEAMPDGVGESFGFREDLDSFASSSHGDLASITSSSDCS